MIDYATFEIITTPSKPPTHCSGKNGSPPLLSAAHNERCDAEEGCIDGASSHHACTRTSDALYCECDKNKDKNERGRSIRHYFSRAKGDMHEYHTLCVYCYEHCNQT
jgi:hypothetical protein